MTGLEAARTAAEAGAWAQALEALQALDDVDASTDEAVELRASVLYATGDLEGCLTTWERLHARRAAAGDRAGSAQAAVMVALYMLIDTGLMTLVRSWNTRAERTLGDLPVGPVHAMIAMIRTYERFFTGDIDGSRAQADVAVALGTEHGVLPAVVIGNVARARLLIAVGDVDAGLRALDEAGAALVDGTVDPLTTGMMLCEVVCAAQWLGMPDLARDWTDFMERWREGAAIGGIHGRCRVHRAELLRISGPCDAAEAEALSACGELRPWMRREYGWPLVELGTIRLRKGDLAGAEEAFLAAESVAWSAQPGLALLRLEQGDPDVAATLIASAVANPDDTPWKERPPSGDLRLAPLLEAQAEIATARGDVAACAAAADRLADISARFASRGLRAAASLAQARTELLRGEHDAAHQHALDAARGWADLDAPFDVATARAIAGDALAAAGRRDAARHEWDVARRGFADYGAARRVDQLTARLSDTRSSATAPLHATFRRDGELRLVSIGDTTVTLPDLVGFRYMDRLIHSPGIDVAATVLVQGEQAGEQVDELGLPALDEQARDAYRRRLTEIEDDIAEATAHNDLGRIARASRDRDFLVAELSRAIGLGGRIRQVGGTAERARTSVFRSIRYALDRLAAAEPVLAEHLRRSIRTGTSCSYCPDPLAPIIWE